MNILFVLYSDFTANSANPLVLYARELKALGHVCAIAVPSNLDTVSMHDAESFIPCLYEDVLLDAGCVFPNGRRADVIHACTPRRGVYQFILEYMAKWPTPLTIFLEDNEGWISRHHLALSQDELNSRTSTELETAIPDVLAHPFEYRYFVALADLAFVIQDKLREDVPAWVPCNTVMLGVDLEFFKPRPDRPESKANFGIVPDSSVIVYHGGANQFTLPGIRTLCEAVVLINEAGVKCDLVRTGPMALGFLEDWPSEHQSYIHDVGIVDKQRLPGILALADIYVQPGRIDPFEDLRLPGKIPEFLAMGKPLVLPDVNIASLFRDGEDAILLKDGSADEIAQQCIKLLKDRTKRLALGKQARRLAEQYFDIKKQARLLESGYKDALSRFDLQRSRDTWNTAAEEGVRNAVLSNIRSVIDGENRAFDTEFVRELSLSLRFEGDRIKSLEERAEASVRKISSLYGRIASLKESNDQSLKQKDYQIAQLEALNAAFLQSRSWRVTRPLRSIARIVSEARKLRTVIFIRIGNAGGIFKAIKLGLQVGKAEGMSGLLSRFKARATDGPGFENNGHYSYQQWIDDNVNSDEIQIREAKAELEGAERRPLISVLMPVFNPPLVYLEKAISSVRNQIYDNWELCVADDASTDPAVSQFLQKCADDDPRIKVVLREENGHISRASNSALALASGDYVALLDHDDMLTPDALLHVAAAVHTHPSVGIIYSDEDKIDGSGKRFDPHFKSDFNYELFLAQNMISHLGVYRRSLVNDIGGFRIGFEGAQDYDLALRVTERLPKRDIHHISNVLYHWRAIAGSTARAGSEKSYATEAGRKAVKEHLARRGVAADVIGAPEAPVFNRVIYSRDYEQPMVSILIPTRDRADLLAMCINSIVQRTTYTNYEVIVIDNGSVEEDTFRLFESFDKSKIRIERNESPFNFSLLNNAAAQLAKGDILCLMNNDIEILTPDWLEEMVSFAIQDDIGAVGARLWYPDGRLQHGGVILGIGGVAGHAHKLLPRGQAGYFGRAILHQSLSAVTAACLVIRRSVFASVGGFDETLAVAFNDVDFCLRVREAGFRNVWTPYAEMNHHESASRGHEDRPEKKLRFAREVAYMQKEWGKELEADPAYNRNLTLASEDFSLAHRRL